MADFYWVGGTGNWSAFATHWATTSGGSIFQANAPTSADNVFFDNNSAAGTFTVTIDTAGATCANFDASGITNASYKMTLTGTASVGLLTVNGNWTNPSSTYFAWTTWTAGTVTFSATGAVITNSVTFAPNFTVSGAGITVTLGGALTVGLTFNLTNGTFDTSAANNYSVTVSGTFEISNNSNTRSLNLNASSITISSVSYNDVSTGGFTLNAGTSTISMTSGGTLSFVGGGKTFYNVTFNTTATNTTTINGANSFNNLSITAPTVTGYKAIILTANQTVTGTLTVGTTSSVSAIRRIFLRSNTLRTQRTITMSGASSSIASVYDVDFRDIVIAQASGSTAAFPDDTSRTYRYGNCQNNSGITFSAGVSRYWNLSGTQNWSSTGWATTNNGSPALANFPLAQDTATFTEVGSAGTVTVDADWNIGSIQMADGVSNRSTAFTLATGATAPSIYGNVTFFSNLTLSGTGTITFSGYNITSIVNSAGITFTQPTTVNMTSGTFSLNGNLTLGTTLTFTLTNGTLDLTNNGAGNYTLSTGLFNSNNSNTRSITFGTGNITTTGSGTVWTTSTVTNFSYTGTPTVNISNNSATATTVTTGTLTESQALNFNYTVGTYTLTDTSAVYKNLDLTGFKGTFPSSNRTIYGNLTLDSGATYASGSTTTTFAAIAGTQTFTSNAVTWNNRITQNSPGTTLRIAGNLTIYSSGSFTFTAGTLDLTNNGAGNYTLSTGTVTLLGALPRVINFGTGNITLTGTGTVWAGSNITNFSYTGTPTINISNNSATATAIATGSPTEANALSFNLTNGTYTFSDNVAYYKNLNLTGFGGTIQNLTRSIYGNLTVVAGVTYSAGANPTQLIGTVATQKITTNSQTLDFPIIQNGVGGTVQLQDNLTIGSTRTYTLTAGTLDLNLKTLSAGLFSSNNSNTRSVTFNGGTVTITGSGVAWNAATSGFTTAAGTGNGTISMTSASAKTFGGGGFVYTAKLDQGGAGTLTISGSNTFSGLSNSSQPATISVTASTTQTFTGAVTLAGTSGNLITLNSVTPGTQFTFTYPTSTAVSNLSYCSIQDCIGYQNAYWRAYQTNGCVNAGNNLGWIFTPLSYSAGDALFTT